MQLKTIRKVSFSSSYGSLRLSNLSLAPPHGMWYEWWPFDPKPSMQTSNAFLTRLESDKWYLWCACGKSQTQPFCDGSHKGTMFRPLAIQGSMPRYTFFCGCKSEHNSRETCRLSCLWVKYDKNLPMAMIHSYLLFFAFGMTADYFFHP